MQWILQRNSAAAGRLAGLRWRSIAYCTTRKALTRLWNEETQLDVPELTTLPETCRTSPGRKITAEAGGNQKSTPETKLRGWVDIYPAAEPNIGFDVYDWDEYHDSGYLIGTFATRHDAVIAALEWAKEHNRKIETADLLSLADYRGEMA